jgi:hypothetical protein
MGEILHKFEDGPYDVLEYTTEFDDDRVILKTNNGDLGRIVLESPEAIEKLTQGLEKGLEKIIEERRSKEAL